MKILLVAPNQSSFIKKDFENLSSAFETNFMTCWSPMQIWATIKKVFSHDLCFFWFGSIRFLPVFLLAKIIGKRTVVVAGGYDVSCIPEIDYGGIRPNHVLGFLRKLLFKNADKVITVSDSNTNEAIKNANIERARIERIYLGFDKPNIVLTPWCQRKNQVVFIAGCDSTSSKIKGFNMFLALARSLPEVTFVHMGQIQVPEFQKGCYELPNVRTLGHVENMNEVFNEVLNDSKVILLPSKIESFGASIIEGSLHGCMPLASECYALPEIIGAMGKICKFEDVDCYKSAIIDILNQDIDPMATQNYYFDKFNSELRCENIIKLLRSLV